MPSKSPQEADPRDHAGHVHRDSVIPIVAIGVSAGGLAPIKEFVKNLKADLGMVYVLIQHFSPSHESRLADLLQKHTDLPVKTVTDGTIVEPNCIYILPPNIHVSFDGARLILHKTPRHHSLRFPIDDFFCSLAEHHKQMAVGIIFSGTGSDGSNGIRAIRENGGTVIVQDPETAEFSGMPRAAIATGMVDSILPVDRIPGMLKQYVRKAQLMTTVEKPPAISGEHLDEILFKIFEETKCDYRNYKKSNIFRRIYRRMGLNQIDSAERYVEYLRNNPEEIRRLRDDFLIGVTGFFREAESFESLLKDAILPLVEEKSPEETIRVWVPGCSTGEEAYSIAILVTERFEESGESRPLQIFATDIDEPSVEEARTGSYCSHIIEDVNPERLNRFFTRKNNRFKVNRQIRDNVVFSVQNVITDPPFSRLDLISCRNLLIYLEPEIQKKLVTMFAFALRPHGYLFMGKSDGIAGREDLFHLVSKKGRLFQKRTTARVKLADFPAVFLSDRKVATRGPKEILPEKQVSLAVLNQQVLLDHFDAAMIIADMKGKILNFFGNSEKYLQFPTGEADFNLIRMTRDQLSLRLRMAIKNIALGEDPVIRQKVMVIRNGNKVPVDVTIRRIQIHGWKEQLVAVVFQDSRKIPQPSGKVLQYEVEPLKALERELQAKSEELRATYEEFDSASEELKEANEEMMTINEELQSTNEELETSKEELQAINQELTTLNSELNEKVEELEIMNNDLANFLNATRVATIFLDRELKIRRYTPKATDLFNFIPGDVGRPIEHITRKFREDLREDIQRVLDDLKAIEKEIHTDDDTWFTLWMFPYRTLDNRIDGVVLTFQDVTRIKFVERFESNIVDMIRHPVAVLDHDLRVNSANGRFLEIFDLIEAKTMGRAIYEVGKGEWDSRKLHHLLEEVLPREGEISNQKIEIGRAGRVRKILMMGARLVRLEPGEKPRVLLAFEEVADTDLDE